MPDNTAFFDTSAIVPLCVAQQSSQKARQIYRGFTRQIVAWTASIEAAGAIYRAVRLGGSQRIKREAGAWQIGAT